MSVLTEAEIRKMSSRVDNSWDLTINTNELSGSQIMELSQMKGAIKMFLSNDNIDKKVSYKIDETHIEDNSKSPSKRLRNVLYRLWEQDKIAIYPDFEVFYKHAMEKYIERIKDELE